MRGRVPLLARHGRLARVGGQRDHLGRLRRRVRGPGGRLLERADPGFVRRRLGGDAVGRVGRQIEARRPVPGGPRRLGRLPGAVEPCAERPCGDRLCARPVPRHARPVVLRNVRALGRRHDDKPRRRRETVARHAEAAGEVLQKVVEVVVVERQRGARDLRRLLDQALDETECLLQRLDRVVEPLQRDRQIAQTQIDPIALLRHGPPAICRASAAHRPDGGRFVLLGQARRLAQGLWGGGER